MCLKNIIHNLCCAYLAYSFSDIPKKDQEITNILLNKIFYQRLYSMAITLGTERLQTHFLVKLGTCQLHFAHCLECLLSDIQKKDQEIVDNVMNKIITSTF